MDRKSTLIAAGALAGTLVAGTATIALTGGALGDRDRGRGGSVADAASPVLGDPSWPAAALGLPEVRGAQQSPVARTSGSAGADRSWGDDRGYEHEDHDERERGEHGGWGDDDD